LLVPVSFAAEPIAVGARGTVVLASDGSAVGAPFDGVIGPDQALVLAIDG
jgi:hypothetical protein